MLFLFFFWGVRYIVGDPLTSEFEIDRFLIRKRDKHHYNFLVCSLLVGKHVHIYVKILNFLEFSKVKYHILNFIFIHFGPTSQKIMDEINYCIIVSVLYYKTLVGNFSSTINRKQITRKQKVDCLFDSLTYVHFGRYSDI